jgi:hypothetical protein
MNLVIPGRVRSTRTRNPDVVVQKAWIPGSRLAARPGMTFFLKLGIIHQTGGNPLRWRTVSGNAARTSQFALAPADHAIPS